MKKERKRRICNYFMKALLLCVLVFGFGFIAGVDVNADEHSFYVDGSGSIKPSSSITVTTFPMSRVIIGQWTVGVYACKWHGCLPIASIVTAAMPRWCICPNKASKATRISCSRKRTTYSLPTCYLLG